MTVQERDELLNKYHIELQNAVSNMSKEELQAQDIKETLQSKAAELAKELSTTTLTFENAEIQSIEIHDGGQEYHK